MQDILFFHILEAWQNEKVLRKIQKMGKEEIKGPCARGQYPCIFWKHWKKGYFLVT